MGNKIWYAVMRDNDDNDWGYGDNEIDKAKAMAREMRKQGHPDAYIAVIDDGIDPVCVDEIRDLDD